MKKYSDIVLILALLAACAGNLYARDLPLEKIKLLPGFKISLFAENLPNARTLVLGENKTLFVGTRTAGNIYAIKDENNDGKADKKYLIASGLNMPNGLAFRKGSLYVAEVDRLLRFDNIENNLANPPQPKIIRDDLPIETHHGWRYIDFGPDDWLYIAIGAPCNICLEADYAQIRRMRADGSDEEVIAEGIRNSVGFTWHPDTKELWFTDNGRDWLGDDQPPGEVNHAAKKGQHFGFPYCHGGTVVDPEYGKGKSCKNYAPPAQALPAHVAPLGIIFYTGKQFPEKYQNQIFIAEHGSWNRKKKSGYKISLIELEENKPVSYTDFAIGWKQGEEAWGRPAYLLNMPDGSLLISDDKNGVIYRITYQTKNSPLSQRGVRGDLNTVNPPQSPFKKGGG